MNSRRSVPTLDLPRPSATVPRTVGRYALRYGTTGIALAAASIVASSSAASADEDYTVEKGDTVSEIALRTGSSASAIRSANNLDAKFRIRAGQTLTIPTGKTVQAAPKTSTQTTTKTSAVTHKVVAGDTVSQIARAHGTTTASIVALNGLNADALIRIGQTLTISASGSGQGAAPSTTGTQLVGDTFAGRTYARDVVSAANENKAALLATSVPSKDEMRTMVYDTARAHGLDPALALAVATQESGFDQRAVSPANAIGTMQVIPTSGDWASDIVGRDLNLLDAQDNVTAGVVILARLVETSPTLDAAIAGYYQGQSSVRKYGMFDDTRRYVANVQTLANGFR